MPEASNRDRLIEEALKRVMRRSMPAADSACLEPERLAAWADGTLPPDEATLVEQHLADCSRCQEVAAVFARTETAVRVPAAPRGIWSVLWRPLPIAALAAAAALVILIALPRTPASLQDRNARVETPAMPVAPPSSPADKPASAAAPTEPAAPVKAPSLDNRSNKSAPVSRRQTAQGDEAAASARLADAVSEAKVKVPAAAPPPPPAPALAKPVAMDAPVTIVAEFAAPGALERSDTAKKATEEFGQAAGRAGGRTAAEAAAPQRSAALSTTPTVRWRISSSGRVERSATNGESWEPIAIDPPAIILAGAAPAPGICWLVGRGGIVLLSTDAAHFTRVTTPAQTDLTSVQARSAREATVTAADGRIFTTTDGGASWR